MARCKFGRLASPVRTSAGGMRRCRKRPKARGGRRRKARGRSCKVYGIVVTRSGKPRRACAAFSRKKSAGPNPSKRWVRGSFMPASEYRALQRQRKARRKAARAARKGPTGPWEERGTPGRMFYRGAARG